MRTTVCVCCTVLTLAARALRGEPVSVVPSDETVASAPSAAPELTPMRRSSDALAVLAPFVERFQWVETRDDGSRLLEEVGERYGLTLKTQPYTGFASLATGLRVYGGVVDYDGETTGTATPQPVTTDTGYLGLDLAMDGGVRLRLHERFWCDLFAGACLKMWRRDIHDAGDVKGYVETWDNVHGRAGVGATCKLPLDFSGFTRLGCMIPIYTRNRIDLSDLGLYTVEVEPEQRFTPFAEAGISWGPFLAGVFYEPMRFDRSDAETVVGYSYPYVYTLEIWQPESQLEAWGVHLGLGGVF